MKYFFNVDKIGYLRYKLRCITNLSSRYAYILFVYLEHNRFRKSWTVDFEDLKTILSCENESYCDTYKVFNDRLLKRIQKELHEKTECRFSYEPIRNGRKVSAIRFTLESRAVLPAEVLPGNPPINPEETDTEELMLKKYGNEKLSFLAGAMNYEFNKEETQVIFDTIVAQYIEPHNDDISRYDFIHRLYNRMQQRAAAKELEPLKNRYSYFKKLVEAEFKKG